MKAPRDPDLIIATWLDEGPTRLPMSTRRAIMVATRSTPQARHRTWVPWRTPMQLITGLSAAALTVAVVGGLGVGLLGSVAAPASPPVPIDTSDWTSYVSDRYGFSIGHPADWTERPAERTWTLASDADFLSPASEGFKAPSDSILATAWSVPVEPGTTVESWLGTYCPLNTTPCVGLADRTTPVTMDGHPGSLVRFTDDVQVFILVDDRMYVVAIWRPESDPLSTAPYGGATRLLEGYLSTMELLPGGPVSSPTDTLITSVSLGIYSGRPDPSWTLTEAESAELARLLGALPSAVGEPPQGGLGYHGFTLAPAGAGTGPQTLVAYRGTVAGLGSGSLTYLVDVDRTVERYLLGIGRSHLSAVEIDAVETDLTTTTGA